jgi:hypothetical protein
MPIYAKAGQVPRPSLSTAGGSAGQELVGDLWGKLRPAETWSDSAVGLGGDPGYFDLDNQPVVTLAMSLTRIKKMSIQPISAEPAAISSQSASNPFTRSITSPLDPLRQIGFGRYQVCLQNSRAE